MAKKNENVAALLNMYWDSVARKPRGPAPVLKQMFHLPLGNIINYIPEDAVRSENETNC